MFREIREFLYRVFIRSITIRIRRTRFRLSGRTRFKHRVYGEPLVQGRRITAVTDKQVEELNIDITPMHPERELRAAGAIFESETAFRDMFANHVVVDGRIVSGQNQNAGPEVANLMIMGAGGTRR